MGITKSLYEILGGDLGLILQIWKSAKYTYIDMFNIYLNI